MKKSMSQRRVPRKIGADDDEDEGISSGADTGSETTGQSCHQYPISLSYISDIPYL